MRSRVALRYHDAMPRKAYYPLPDELTKVSYILPKVEKEKLEAAAKKAGVSMSTFISGILKRKLK